MITYKKIGCSLLLSSTLLTHSVANAMYLNDAVEKALKTYPELLAAERNKEAVEKEIDMAFAGHLPTLDLAGEVGREQTDSPNTRTRGDSSVELLKTGVSLTLKQNIFAGFKVQSAIDEAKAKYKSTQFSYHELAETIANNTTQNYLDILKHQELLSLVKDNLVLHQKILKQTHERSIGGVGSVADIHQTQSRLALVSAQFSATDGLLRNSKERFFALVGVDPDELHRPTGVLSLAPKDKQQAAQEALEKHPRILALNSDLEAANYAVSGKNANYYPRFDVEAGIEENNNTSGMRGRNASNFVMLKMNYNLFKGDFDRSAKHQALMIKNKTTELLNNERRMVKQNVNSAWNTWKISIDRVRYLTKQVEISQSVTHDYHSQHDLGTRTLLDVLNSENELFRAKSMLVTEKYNQLGIVFELLTNMGKLRHSLTLLKESQGPQQTVQLNSLVNEASTFDNTVLNDQVVDLPVDQAEYAETETLLKEMSVDNATKATENRAYALLIGNYNTGNIVEGMRWMEKAKELGFPVFMQQMYEQGIPYTGIYSGPFHGQSETQAVINKLNEEKEEIFWTASDVLFAPKAHWGIKQLPKANNIPELETASEQAVSQLKKGGYMLLVGHYEDAAAEYVTLFAQNLKSHDIPAYSADILIDKQAYHSLFAGPFETKAEAEKTLKRLQTEFNTLLNSDNIIFNKQ